MLEIAEVCARPKVYRLPAKGWIAQSAEIVGFDWAENQTLVMQNFDSAINKFKNHYFHRFIAILVTCTEQYFALCHYADCRLCCVSSCWMSLYWASWHRIFTLYWQLPPSGSFCMQKINMKRASLLWVCNSRLKFKKTTKQSLSAVFVNSPHV